MLWNEGVGDFERLVNGIRQVANFGVVKNGKNRMLAHGGSVAGVNGRTD